jgi:hypothetical protein
VDPPTVTSSTFTASDTTVPYKYTTSIEFTCNNGYATNPRAGIDGVTKVTQQTVTCTETAAWSGSTTNCLGIHGVYTRSTEDQVVIITLVV